jgi:hypothetical protein
LLRRRKRKRKRSGRRRRLRVTHEDPDVAELLFMILDTSFFFFLHFVEIPPLVCTMHLLFSDALENHTAIIAAKHWRRVKILPFKESVQGSLQFLDYQRSGWNGVLRLTYRPFWTLFISRIHTPFAFRKCAVTCMHTCPTCSPWAVLAIFANQNRFGQRINQPGRNSHPKKIQDPSLGVRACELFVDTYLSFVGPLLHTSATFTH